MNKLLKKFRGMFGILAALMVISSMLIPASAAQAVNPAQVWVDPAQTITSAGENFDLHINASTTVPVSAVGFKVDWSGPVGTLTCTGIEFVTGAGSFFEGKSTLPILGGFDPTTGTINQYALASTSGDVAPGTSGPVAVLHFTATASGQVDVTLENVQVAAAGEPVDSDNTNGVVYVGLPDLVITDVHETWDTPGSTYNISYTIKNQGTADAVASSTEIKVDGAVFQTDSQSILAPGAEETKVVGPVTFTPDSDSITVTADSAAVVFESDEANNVLSSVWSNNRIYVDNTTTSVTKGSLFDVKVNLASMTPAQAGAFRMTWDPEIADLLSVEEGTFFSASGSTMTVGGTPGPDGSMSTQYAVALIGPNTATGDGRLATLKMKAMNAGTLTLNFEEVQVVTPAQELIDVTEIEPYTIEVTLGNYVDVEAVSKTERIVSENGTTVYYVDYVVRNTGNKDVPEGCTISVYESTSNDGSGDPIYVKKGDVFWLGLAGTETTGSFGPYPAPAIPAPVKIKLVGDSTNNAPADINKDNNVLVNDLYEGAPGLPNLVISDFQKTATTPGHYTISIKVKNLGPAEAAASKAGLTIDGIDQPMQDVAALAAGAESAVIIFPASGDYATSGIHDVITATADAAGNVLEWNESDNTRGAYTVQDECDTPVSGTLLPEITLTCPGPIEYWDWTLKAGETASIDRTYNVKANVPWVLEALDDNETTAGHLKEFDPTANDYVVNGANLIMPIKITGPDGGGYMPASVIIKQGDPLNQVGDSGEDFDVNFSQKVEWQDQALINGNYYHMKVHFIAGANF